MKRTAMLEAADRYGGNYPDLKTMCKGQCEGLGLVPVYRHERDRELRKRWEAAEKNEHAPDGCHFVKCPDCDGTGKRLNAKVSNVRKNP